MEARAQGYQLHLLDATNTLTTIVNQIIADEQLQTLGFEGQQVSWETAHRWKSELNAKLVSATPDVLRQIKTPEEVEIIRLACGICRSRSGAYSPLYSGGDERARDSR
ncbi:aminopeptidase [Escherichia coli]|uniref:Aminopeptidase n=1 Tax=Escherichia coli TaxID=562 RepID=A0A376KPJ5_ECOLX|nr:aminopeptidase [Escherichia coli]